MSSIQNTTYQTMSLASV